MSTLKFTVKDSNLAHIDNNLLLPKAFINVAPVKAALEFPFGEEMVLDEETQEIVNTRIGTLRLWDETEHHLVVPRHFLSGEERKRFSFEFMDHNPRAFERTSIRDKISLRDERQVAAFDALVENLFGTLNLSCGTGKTVLALKLAAALSVPTIVVVNTTALLEQWKKEIHRHLDVASIGTVQGKTADWHHPIVLAMVHTLSGRRYEWPMEFRRRFGLVFYDECHHMSAPVFVLSADLFYGRRYSLTATPYRTDGLESIYQYHLGRVIHSDLEQTLVPRTIFHALKWTFPSRDKMQVVDSGGDINLTRVRGYLGRLDWRNQVIYEDLLSDLSEGRQILVLSHSVAHVSRLHDMLAAYGAGMITGQTPQEDRLTILESCNPVFGTFQLAREGLDKPRLDTLYITTPFSASNDLQQSWGRIQRQFPGKKEPRVRVYEDGAFNCTVKCCRSLRRHLKSLDYPNQRKNIKVETT